MQIGGVRRSTSAPASRGDGAEGGFFPLCSRFPTRKGGIPPPWVGISF